MAARSCNKLIVTGKEVILGSNFVLCLYLDNWDNNGKLRCDICPSGISLPGIISGGM